MSSTRALPFLLVLGLAIPALPASAQPVSLVPKWELEIGSWFTTTETNIRADRAVGDLGTEFDVEDVLGLDDSETVLRLSLARRLGRRHQLRLRHSEFSRQGQRTIPVEIDFQDTTFPVNVVIATEWDFTFTDLGYTWFFSLDDDTAWGLGLAVANWDFDIALSASLAGTPGALREEVRIDELVPEVGLSLRQRLGEKLIFRAGVSGLTAEVDEDTIDVLSAVLRLDYRLFRNAGIAVAALYSEVEYDAAGAGDFIGRYEYTVSGVQVFVPLTFD